VALLHHGHRLEGILEPMHRLQVTLVSLVPGDLAALAAHLQEVFRGDSRRVICRLGEADIDDAGERRVFPLAIEAIPLVGNRQ
jgi:hypothetical protein